MNLIFNDMALVKSILGILVGIIVLVWIAQPSIKWSPFSLEFKNGMHVLGLTFVMLGIAIIQASSYHKGKNMTAENIAETLLDFQYKINLTEKVYTKNLEDSIKARSAWVEKAVEDAGYPKGTNFNVVWEETLNKSKNNHKDAK